MNGVLMLAEITHEELAARKVQEKGDFNASELFDLADVTIAHGFHPAIALGAAIVRRNLAQFGRVETIDPQVLANLK